MIDLRIIQLTLGAVALKYATENQTPEQFLGRYHLDCLETILLTRMSDCGMFLVIQETAHPSCPDVLANPSDCI